MPQKDGVIPAILWSNGGSRCETTFPILPAARIEFNQLDYAAGGRSDQNSLR